MWVLSVLAQAPSPSIDPVEAAKVFGVALPMISTLGVWLRMALKERDEAVAKADAALDQRLSELRELLPLARSMIEVAERMDRRLDER